MKKYGCTRCAERFDTFEEALPHHNQITGHNICTPPIEDCPSCAALRADVVRLMADIVTGDNRIALLEKVAEEVITDHDERVAIFGLLEQQVCRVKVMENLRAALVAAKEGK